MKADLLRARKTSNVSSLKLKTSLCYNPTMERLTLTIYQLEGLEVSVLTILFDIIVNFQLNDGADMPDTYIKVTFYKVQFQCIDRDKS